MKLQLILKKLLKIILNLNLYPAHILNYILDEKSEIFEFIKFSNFRELLKKKN